jgi:hypothetical protein
MSRVRLIVTAVIAVLSAALAGCSGTSFSMPDWLSSSPPPPQLQTLQFESQPSGADVRTQQGQTCQTPCSLAVPPENQAVSFSKLGFVPQTVQVGIGPVPDHSFFESAPPPALTPNPVMASLQPAAPPPRRPPVRPPHKVVAHHNPPPPPPSGSPFPPPPPQQPPGSPFPPPPGQ